MTITIVGGETLLGRELREGLAGRKIAATVELVAAEAQISVLADAGDEPLVVAAMNAGQLVDSSVIFCAGSRSSTQKAYDLARKSKAEFFDLTFALEEEPAARVYSPLPGRTAVLGVKPAIHIVPHPAAMAIARLLIDLNAVAPVIHSVVTVYEPASERGQAGINELQQQTTSLLAFRPLEKRVFDAQVAFNLLPRIGEDAPESLEDIEERIERHTATLLSGSGGSGKLPSLRVIQAPVFHGYSMSIWTQFETRPEVDAIQKQLRNSGADVRGASLEPPNNAGIAGQSGLAVGLIEADRNYGGGTVVVGSSR